MLFFSNCTYTIVSWPRYKILKSDLENHAAEKSNVSPTLAWKFYPNYTTKIRTVKFRIEIQSRATI